LKYKGLKHLKKQMRFYWNMESVMTS
jgi:hypothetical protein